MTITLQAVNELIASLESAGELSIREQKFLKLAKAFKQLAAENAYLLSGAARELNTSWMFHKTMLGAQAALACLSLGRESAARDWLEGTTDEACAEIPDDITVAGLQAWFDSQMVSNDGKSGFLTRAEAEEAIKKACPATDRIVAGIKADGVEEFIGLLQQHVDEGDFVGDEVAVIVGAIDCGKEFFEQLREGGRQMSNRIPSFGWNRLKLATLTYEQLAQLEEQVKAEHACKNGIHLFDKAGQRKLDALSWAVYNKQKAERAA